MRNSNTFQQFQFSCSNEIGPVAATLPSRTSRPPGTLRSATVRHPGWSKRLQAWDDRRPMSIWPHTYQLQTPARSQIGDYMWGLAFVPAPCRHSCWLVYCTGGTGCHLQTHRHPRWKPRVEYNRLNFLACLLSPPHRLISPCLVNTLQCLLSSERGFLSFLHTRVNELFSWMTGRINMRFRREASMQ